MTLRQWSEKWDIALTPKLGCVVAVLPLQTGYTEVMECAYRLKDYVVSSRYGATLYFMPRAKRGE